MTVSTRRASVCFALAALGAGVAFAPPAVAAGEGKDAGKAAVNAPPAADFSSPKAALKTFYGAVRRGDAPGIEAAMFAPTPSHEKVRSAFAEMVAARARLRAAVAAKFGAAAVPADADVPDAAAIDAAAEKVDGDRAAVDVKNGNGDVAKVNGRWQSAALTGLTKEAADQMAPILGLAAAQSAEMKKAAGDVAEGRVPTAAEARKLVDKYPMPFSARTEPAQPVKP